MYHAGGFYISVNKFGPFEHYDAQLDFHSISFVIAVETKRQISRYVLQYYLPSITIVVASSFSFIIPLSAIPGRVALVVTQFLTLTNIFIHQQVILTIHNQTLYHFDLKRSRIKATLYFPIIFDRTKAHQPNKQPPLESIFLDA